MFDEFFRSRNDSYLIQSDEYYVEFFRHEKVELIPTLFKVMNSIWFLSTAKKNYEKKL